MYARELAVAQRAAVVAGEIIRRHYEGAAVTAEHKGDGSPVTIADLEANEAILGILRDAFPDDGFLSEEAADDGARLAKARVWIIDPLDGTRDFVSRSGEFCVHIGLAVEGAPVVGVVMRPVTNEVFAARRGEGVVRTCGAEVSSPRVSQVSAVEELRLGISRQNVPPALIARLTELGLLARAVHLGASVKYLALAAGELDAIVTITGGEKEWDTCAPELVVREAGGMLTDLDGRTLRYNQRDVGRPRGVVVSNGSCHPTVLRLFAGLGGAAA